MTPYEGVIEKINRSGGTAYGAMPFLAPYPKSMEEICERIKNLCKEPGKKYIYGYWNQPDGLLHRNGCNAQAVKDELEKLERLVNRLAEECEDTLFFVTADHGHIDTEYVVLQDYPTLCDCLERLPSLEPRVLNFFVKEEKKDVFEAEFQKEFGDRFLLLPMEEAIEKKLFGTGAHHKNFRGMLGNYLAIATGNLSILYTDERFVSMHGSVTEDEMMIPLIVFGHE